MWLFMSLMELVVAAVLKSTYLDLVVFNSQQCSPENSYFLSFAMMRNPGLLRVYTNVCI